MKHFRFLVCELLLLSILISSCSASGITTPTSSLPKVLAVESFLADITRNVTGDRLTVESLIPLGVDPHAYQPTPQDAARITNASVLILNGVNLEGFLDPILQNEANKNQLTIKASDGLSARPNPTGDNSGGDPHFWLDPNNVIRYVENIRDGLTNADPAGESVYRANADKYITSIKILDKWISSQVQQVPETRRLLVTNHDSLGYFADRYGFKVIGAIIPSISSGAAPSAQELASLITSIRSSGAPAIFLETGTNTQLADQIAAETGVRVVTGLYLHSLSNASGPASTYVDMMQYDVNMIVNALK
jgi:ABC-type Zn uptake system ZnuABC Zn-binding protein ZnuA